MSLLILLAERSLSIFLSRFSFSRRKVEAAAEAAEALWRESLRRASSAEGSLERRDPGRSPADEVEARLQVEWCSR